MEMSVADIRKTIKNFLNRFLELTASMKLKYRKALCRTFPKNPSMLKIGYRLKITEIKLNNKKIKMGTLKSFMGGLKDEKKKINRLPRASCFSLCDTRIKKKLKRLKT